MLKIATWNVNSLRVRLEQLQAWLNTARPDVLALQETKVEDKDFPTAALQAAGYHFVYAGQKTYNGVAIMSRTKLRDTATEIPGFLDDPSARILATTVAGIRVINLYVPNGESVTSDKYQYKLNWLAKITDYIYQQLQLYPQLVVVGDFNVAPEDRDIHDPEVWKDQVLVSEPERAALRGICALGLQDTFRLFPQAPASFSWWDYRAGSFRRNAGLRIDLILASKALASRCISCHIDKTPREVERPSDHTPVLATFETL